MPTSLQLRITERRSPYLTVGTATTRVAERDWREQLPILSGTLSTLRELEMGDAPSLLAMVGTEDVARFIAVPPATVRGFETFIAWMHEQQRRGEYACFGVVPRGMSAAIGLFQIRKSYPGSPTAEWGFAIGSAYWGTGVFSDGASLAVDFAFGTLGIHRLEARTAVANVRGSGALRKMGAIPEAVLRRGLCKHGEYFDQMLWSILADDWKQRTAFVSPRVTVH